MCISNVLVPPRLILHQDGDAQDDLEPYSDLET